MKRNNQSRSGEINPSKVEIIRKLKYYYPGNDILKPKSESSFWFLFLSYKKWTEHPRKSVRPENLPYGFRKSGAW